MDLSKTKATLFKSLSTKKMRDKHGLFLAEGEKCALDLTDAFTLQNLIVTSGWIEHNSNLEKKFGDKILIASPDQLKYISSFTTPPDVIAVFQIPEENKFDYKLDENKLYVGLDGIQDPGNFGSILRTCDWFGINLVFASKDTVNLYNPKVVQATMGSLARVKVIYCNLIDLLDSNADKQSYGTFLDGDNMFEIKTNFSGILIMGNEGNGISNKVEERIKRRLYIPPYDINNHGESLNVGAATAITLSYFRNHSSFC